MYIQAYAHIGNDAPSCLLRNSILPYVYMYVQVYAAQEIACLARVTRDQRALDVLALRTGLALADALQPFCDGRITLKWPNDLFLGTGKLAGILIEARWRESLPEWVAIGVGVNRRVPAAIPGAASVREDIARDALLRAMLPAMRGAAALVGSLTAAECAQWAERDLAYGREITEPRPGRAMGIDAAGALRIVEPRGAIYAARSGSLVFAEEAP